LEKVAVEKVFGNRGKSETGGKCIALDGRPWRRTMVDTFLEMFTMQRL